MEKIQELRETIERLWPNSYQPKLQAAKDLLDSAEENLEKDPLQAQSSIKLAVRYIQRASQI